MHYDRSINYHSILGLWDWEILSVLDRVFVRGELLTTDSTVADVGANVGYYAMWFSKMVRPQRTYAFEPSPEVLPLLQENLRLNDLKAVEVVAFACGDRTGETEFFVSLHHHRSSLNVNWATGEHGNARKITVPMTTLDAFFAPDTGRTAPSFLKIDIEGGATQALPGCRRIFAEARPFVLIESHTPDEDRAICDVLCGFDYRGYRVNDRSWVKNANTTHPDPNGVWGTLLLVPGEHFAAVSGNFLR